jgi:hypothetical protein
MFLQVCNTEVIDRRGALVWLPIYTGSYTFEGTPYLVCVDGVSGQMEGQRPFGTGVVGRALAWIGASVKGWFGRGSSKKQDDDTEQKKK